LGGSCAAVVPGLDEPTGDRRFAGQADGARAGEGLAGFGTGEPAQVDDLLAVRGGLLVGCGREEADHERAWVRPRLRVEVLDAAEPDARLLGDLPVDGRLEGLTRLDEAGEARVEAPLPRGVGAEQ